MGVAASADPIIAGIVPHIKSPRTAQLCAIVGLGVATMAVTALGLRRTAKHAGYSSQQAATPQTSAEGAGAVPPAAASQTGRGTQGRTTCPDLLYVHALEAYANVINR